MSDYTPTTEEVRAAYRAWSDGQDDSHPDKPAWSAEEFDRWLAAHDAQKRAEWEAEQGEVEWEYGLVNETARAGEYGPHDRAHLVSRNREHIERQQRRGHPSIRVMRRRPAGEWLPVNENGETPPAPKRRLRSCVEQWPECETGAYDPACCRFPKSCSATVYDESRATDADLEPATDREVGSTDPKETP